MLKKLTALYALVRGDAAELWFALRHPARPAWLRPAVALLALYVFSPMDLLPDLIPGIGFIDDLVLVPMAMAWLVRMLPPGVRRGVGGNAQGLATVPVRTR